MSRRRRRKSGREMSGAKWGFGRRLLRVEPLEDRRLLAVFTVSNLDDGFVDSADDQPGTLRQAIFDANAAGTDDVIEFEAELSGTLTLLHGQLTISDDLTITGPGAEALTVNANGGSRVFFLDDGNFGTFSDVTITDVTITGGATSEAGGGILSYENLTVERSAIVGNQAVDGGGISNLGGVFSIVDSTLSGNTATHSGGGIRNNAGAGGISNSTLSGNTAQYGGGVYVDTALAQVTTISNSTISGNTASDGGGGVYNFLGHLVIEFSTITNNKADIDRGGGVVSWGDLDLTFTEVYSSIISGNLESDGSDGTDVDLVGGPIGGPYDTIQSNGYNIVGTGSATDLFVATGDLPPGTDPLLGPLFDYGGPTHTHILLFGSPAFDAGDPSFASPPDFDQRGEPFVREFGAAIDIGAYEFDNVYFVVDTLVDDDDLDYSAGDFSLREAIGQASTLTVGSPIILFHESLFSGGPAEIELLLGQLVIDARMSIYGPAANQLTIDAQGDSRVFAINDADNSGRIDVLLSGLTISGGHDVNGGGGILSNEELFLADSVVTGNEAQWGGGLYNTNYGHMTVLRSIVSSNTTTAPGLPPNGSGGGIYNWGGTLQIYESTITGNTASDAAGIRNINGGDLVLIDSTVSENTAENEGGGLLNSGSHAYVLNSTLSDNGALFGAGIANVDDGNLFIERSRISGNTAGNAGGGVFNDFGTVHVSRSTVNDNTGVYGGGLYLSGNLSSLMTITNSTISGNTAIISGGGLYNFQGTARISFSTITANNAENSSGGGIGSWASVLTAVTYVHSSIVAGNIGTDLFVFDVNNNSFISLGYNLIGVGDGMGEFVETGDQVGVTDPKLDSLADNGGPTWTHALQSNSPALNAGDATAIAGEGGVPNFDQRGLGFDRIIGAAIDIGAFEAPAAPTLLGDYNSDDVVNAADYVLWRDTLGSTTNLVANGDDSNSVIDMADYGVWKENFGAPEGGGASASIAGDLQSPEFRDQSSESMLMFAALDSGERGSPAIVRSMGDSPVREVRSTFRSSDGPVAHPTGEQARMLALLDLLDSMPVQDDDAESDSLKPESDEEAEREEAFAALGTEVSVAWDQRVFNF